MGLFSYFRPHHARRRRGIVLVVLAVFLAWRVVTESLAAYLAGTMPRVALWLDPGQPAALVALADQAFDLPAAAEADAGVVAAAGNIVEDGEDLSQAFSAFESVGRDQSAARPLPPRNATLVRARARSAVMNAPLCVPALRVLGQLAEADGDDAVAGRFMRAAARLSLHDNIADYWLMKKSVAAGDDASAVYYADVLMRTTPQLARFVVPALARIAESGRSGRLVDKLLTGNPPWRAEFFSLLPVSVTDERVPLDLLLRLRKSAAPPTAAEVENTIDFLVARRHYELAYYIFLQFLPPRELRSAGFLFNSSFEDAPSGAPFDWRIVSGAGVTVDIVPRADGHGRHTLMVDFQYGRVDYRSVSELVMLGPGSYEFKARFKGQLAGPRGLKWRIACAAGPRIGETPMIIGMMPDWRTVTFTFTVPPKDCRAQYVRLDLDARTASEQLVSGSMLFDRLEIARAATGNASRKAVPDP